MQILNKQPLRVQIQTEMQERIMLQNSSRSMGFLYSWANN